MLRACEHSSLLQLRKRSSVHASARERAQDVLSRSQRPSSRPPSFLLVCLQTPFIVAGYVAAASPRVWWQHGNRSRAGGLPNQESSCLRCAVDPAALLQSLGAPLLPKSTLIRLPAALTDPRHLPRWRPPRRCSMGTREARLGVMDPRRRVGALRMRMELLSRVTLRLPSASRRRPSGGETGRSAGSRASR